MIDLVEISKQIKDGIFTTYLSKGNIYLKNKINSKKIAIFIFIYFFVVLY